MPDNASIGDASLGESPAGDVSADDGYRTAVSLRQYAYLNLAGETVTAAEMTARLGIDPDRTTVRGSRIPRPPLPSLHNWSIECREPGLSVDLQVGRVLSRVRPIAIAMRDLVATGEVMATMRVVRYFDTGSGEGGAFHSGLFGWAISADDLGFLVSLGAGLDVDEYGG